MKKEVTIVLAEDDMGHATLIQRNLRRSGITNEIIHLKDGDEALDFLFRRVPGPSLIQGRCYLLLLDIKMPKVDGVEVLRQIKSDPELRKIPVIMLTTTDDPREVDRCHTLGCSSYIAKPVDYDKFVMAIRQLGLFLAIVEVPRIDGETSPNG